MLKKVWEMVALVAIRLLPRSVRNNPRVVFFVVGVFSEQLLNQSSRRRKVAERFLLSLIPWHSAARLDRFWAEGDLSDDSPIWLVLRGLRPAPIADDDVLYFLVRIVASTDFSDDVRDKAYEVALERAGGPNMLIRHFSDTDAGFSAWSELSDAEALEEAYVQLSSGTTGAALATATVVACKAFKNDPRHNQREVFDTVLRNRLAQTDDETSRFFVIKAAITLFPNLWTFGAFAFAYLLEIAEERDSDAELWTLVSYFAGCSDVQFARVVWTFAHSGLTQEHFAGLEALSTEASQDPILGALAERISNYLPLSEVAAARSHLIAQQQTPGNHELLESLTWRLAESETFAAQ